MFFYHGVLFSLRLAIVVASWPNMYVIYGNMIYNLIQSQISLAVSDLGEGQKKSVKK